MCLSIVPLKSLVFCCRSLLVLCLLPLALSCFPVPVLVQSCPSPVQQAALLWAWDTWVSSCKKSSCKKFLSGFSWLPLVSLWSAISSLQPTDTSLHLLLCCWHCLISTYCLDCYLLLPRRVICLSIKLLIVILHLSSPSQIHNSFVFDLATVVKPMFSVRIGLICQQIFGYKRSKNTKITVPYSQ